MRKSIFLLFLAAMVMGAPFFLTQADAQSKITEIRIVTPAWEDFTNKDGTGVYFDLLRAVYEPEGIRVRYEFFPWSRAEAMIRKNRADAMLAAFYNPKNEDQTRYPRYPLDSEIVNVAYKKGTVSQWKGEKSLSGKAVSWPRGYDYHNYMKVKVKAVEVDSNEQGWQMMDRGRVDFHMASLEELEKQLKAQSAPDDYVIQEVLTKQLYVWFGKNERTEKLAAIYDRRIQALKDTDSLKPIFDKYDLPMPRFVPRTP